jgi:hypothetical protein
MAFPETSNLELYASVPSIFRDIGAVASFLQYTASILLRARLDEIYFCA